MKKAYVWNDKEGDEEVIIASSKKEAREVVKDENAQFIEEPVRAYNTPDNMGIVLATSINDIRTNEKTNMEYWDKVNDIVYNHVAACIQELKKWSVSNFKHDEEFSEEEITFEISKEIGEVLFARLEEDFNADFPVLCSER